ncbi:MAG: DUF6527 family protein [Tepidisphaeraceae bacterium]
MKRFFRWCSRLWRRLRHDSPRIRLKRVPELPDKLKPHTLYVECEGKRQWLAAMLCPCGCRETLHMSLLSDDRPRWKLTIHRDGTPSLSPSIWRHVGCRSHFFLRNGRIRWV